MLINVLEDTTENSSNPLSALLFIVGTIVFIIVFFPWLAKVKKFWHGEEGHKIVAFLKSNHGFTKNEFLDSFSTSKYKFTKVVKYLFLDKDVKTKYGYDKNAGLIYVRNCSFKSTVNGGFGRKEFNYILNKKNQFLNDSKLSTIVNNHYKQNSSSIIYLELCSILFTVDPCELGKSYHLDKNEYAMFLGAAFYSDTISYDSFQTKNILSNVAESEAYIGLKHLFDLLIQQKQIVDNNNVDNLLFVAFCYFYYCKYREKLKEDTESFIEIYKLDFENHLEESIVKMYKAAGENAAIGSYLFYNCNKYNYLAFSCFESCKEKVTSIINNNKQKEDLEDLITGRNITSKVKITDTDLMTGDKFEELVVDVLRKSGYSCSITKKTGDQGVDIVATKDFEKVAVQCKCYNNTVGNHAVMEAVAGSKYYNCNKAMVVTNNYFTKGAIELAKVNGVILWDRDELAKRL